MKTLLKGMIFLLPGFLLVTSVYGQLEPPQISKDKNFNKPVGLYDKSGPNSNSKSATGLTNGPSDLGEECSMYLQDGWKNGTIELMSNTIYEDVPLRYNIYNQQIEFVQNEDTAAIGDPTKIKSIRVDGQTFIYGEFICEGKVNKGYLEVLVDGRLRLLLYRCIKYVYVEQQQSVIGIEHDKKYFLEKKYLYANPGEDAIKLPEKKKEILNLFSGKMSMMKSYLKESNNNLRDEHEFIEAFTYYNNIGL